MPQGMFEPNVSMWVPAGPFKTNGSRFWCPDPFMLNAIRFSILPHSSMQPLVAGLVLLCDPFDPNGSMLGPFGSNGLMFGGCPGKSPRAEGVRGGGNLSPLRWSRTLDQRDGGMAPQETAYH